MAWSLQCKEDNHWQREWYDVMECLCHVDEARCPSLQLCTYVARQVLRQMQVLHNSNTLTYAGLPQLLVPDQHVDLGNVGDCPAEGSSGELY